MRPSSIVFLNDFCIRYIQSEIESLVTHGASECYGTYNDTTKLGSGAGYINNCIHSGSNDYSGGSTVWYNYATASAGTITNRDVNDTTGNLNTATESICPKGWSLPFEKQMNRNTSSSIFNPIFGGDIWNGDTHYVSEFGFWWGSEADNDAQRYGIIYYGGNLYSSDYYRYSRYKGIYIRCVSEEKTVTDLTYMQDMTPKIAPVLSFCI